jgi:transposase-like protein
MSARAVPFHCPYCGDENLWPHEPEAAESTSGSSSGHGQWECRSCLRAFKLTMIGQLRPPATAHAKGDVR